MKKLTALLIMSLLILSAMQSVAFAEEPFLIVDTQLKPSPTVAPNRLLLSFDLSESIDLSQEKTDIIIEYLGENLETTNYIKNKLWSGYLNSYENYPSGEQKYSSGYTNENYPDIVPAQKIYTVTKTGENIDIIKVSAVKITVLRADGSGEEITVSIDGNVLAFKEVEPTDDEETGSPTDDGETGNPPGETVQPGTEKNLGIKIDSEAVILPPNTILLAEELSSGSVYDAVSLLLTNTINFIVIDIKLESNGQPVQPDDKVKISIPIPEGFNSSNLAVYRIDDDGRRIPYAVTITTNEGTEYATFLTDHFSTYVLAEERKAEERKEQTQNKTPQIMEGTPNRREANEDLIQNKLAKNKLQENKAFEEMEIEENKIPQTGRARTQNYIIAIISITGLLAFINTKKINPATKKQSRD